MADELNLMRTEFEKEVNNARFFPAEMDFSRTKSPSGRDEYANPHLQSRWEGWQAAWNRRAAPSAEASAQHGSAAQAVGEQCGITMDGVGCDRADCNGFNCRAMKAKRGMGRTRNGIAGCVIRIEEWQT